MSKFVCSVVLGCVVSMLTIMPTPAQETKPQKQEISFLDRIQAPKGFQVEKLYEVPDNQGSWVSLTTDPKGRLITSDQYGKLYRVTPPTKGKAIQVEQIPVDLGEAQGLLWAFDSLYVMVNRGGKYESGLYRVQDTNNDDVLDSAKLLRALNGRTEHGPHAVILAPDGKSLFVIAGNHTKLTDLADSRASKKWDEDSLLTRMWDASGHAVGRMAPGGWIAKVDPDGKNWTLWCAGFRNAYDIAFNKAGELFTFDSDMEWDMNTPWYRPTRVCHCVSGAAFGWRGGTAKFPTYYPDNLPPVVDIGPGSPTGIVFGYGAKFPAKYQEALFICDWSYGKLYAVHMKEVGSTYKGDAEEFITGTPLALTDIIVNPKDGAMYFTTGGRRTKSFLYRVTYTGKESTSPSKAKSKDAKARSIRHMLEQYHSTKANPKAIEKVWPYLSNKDRFIRWAARTAVEHQDVKLWQKKALAEKSTQASLEALLALTRCGAKGVQPQVFEALDRIDWNKLDQAQKFALLRVYQLAMIRMGRPDVETADALIAKFDPHYPAKSRDMNAELAKLLIYLEAPSAATKTMALLKKALTQEEQTHYALFLRELKKGWTMDQRKDYFRWYLKAANFKGGHSYQKFIINIKRDAVAKLSPSEKLALKKILNAKPPKQAVPVFVEKRPVVKDWKLDELVAKLQTGLKGRNFDKGRKMFAVANCFACHRFDNEGGAVGPDLTGVSGRFSPRDLLESIIHPSKTISDQYSAVNVFTKSGKIVTGRIVNLAGQDFRINTDMYNPDKQAIVKRNDVESIVPSPVSMMPEDLLNTLHEEEIMDLMAYLLSRGNRNHPIFSKNE